MNKDKKAVRISPLWSVHADASGFRESDILELAEMQYQNDGHATGYAVWTMGEHAGHCVWVDEYYTN